MQIGNEITIWINEGTTTGSYLISTAIKNVNDGDGSLVFCKQRIRLLSIVIHDCTSRDKSKYE
jgi:hypothetical protein